METVLDQLVTARTAERRERALARARLALAELGRRGVRAGIIGSLERIMDDIGFALPALRRSSRRAGRCRQHAADRRSQRKNRSAFAARLLRAAASRSEQMLALQCSERRVLSWVSFAGGALQARLFCQRRQTREQRPENQPPRVLGDHEQQVKQAAFPASGANAPGSLCRAVAAG